jgi:hypothetical protein
VMAEELRRLQELVHSRTARATLRRWAT